MSTLVKNIPDPKMIAGCEDTLRDAIDSFTPAATGLSPVQRKNLRKMGTARQGYTALVLPIAKNNVGELPARLSPQRLDDLTTAFKNLTSLRGLAKKMFEMVDDTMMALGIDAVQQTDSTVASLQDARKTNDLLDGELGEVDEYNSRFANQMAAEDTSDTNDAVSPAAS